MKSHEHVLLPIISQNTNLLETYATAFVFSSYDVFTATELSEKLVISIFKKKIPPSKYPCFFLKNLENVSLEFFYNLAQSDNWKSEYLTTDFISMFKNAAEREHDIDLISRTLSCFCPDPVSLNDFTPLEMELNGDIYDKLESRVKLKVKNKPGKIIGTTIWDLLLKNETLSDSFTVKKASDLILYEKFPSHTGHGLYK